MNRIHANIMKRKAQSVYDEIIKYIDNCPYNISSAVDDEKVREIAFDIAEGSYEDYMDSQRD